MMNDERGGLAMWVPWPVLSERGIDGHGQARTDRDGTVRENAISQDPLHLSSLGNCRLFPGVLCGTMNT